MSATRVTFLRVKGGWVAHGPADQMHLGDLEVHKKDGSTCPQEVLALGEVVVKDGVECRIGYLGKGCGKAHAPAPSQIAAGEPTREGGFSSSDAASHLPRSSRSAHPLPADAGAFGAPVRALHRLPHAAPTAVEVERSGEIAART